MQNLTRYVICYNPANLIEQQVASNLAVQLTTRLSDNHTKSLKSNEIYLYTQLIGTTDIPEKTMDIPVKYIFIVLTLTDDCLPLITKNSNNARVILRLLPNDIAHNPNIHNFMSEYRCIISKILTPIPSLINPDVPPLDAINTPITQREDGLQVINYIGTFPDNISYFPVPNNKKAGLYAVMQNGYWDYDWCLVAHALTKTHVTILYEKSDTDWQLNVVPPDIKQSENVSLLAYESVPQLVDLLRTAQGVIQLPTMSNRIFGCSDINYLLPYTLGVFNQSLQEMYLMNIHKSVLATADIGVHDATWESVLTGILDPQPQLDVILQTLTSTNYRGFRINDNTGYSLVDIVLSMAVLAEADTNKLDNVIPMKGH